MMLVAALPACLYLLIGLAPSRWANRHVYSYGTLLQSCAGAALVLAVLAAGLLLVGNPPSLTGAAAVYFDGLAATMLVLISGIGLTVVRFSRRYLDGDPAQGRFLKWMSLTLGAALWLVVARNLLVLTIAWMLTSFALHQLLIHYPERTWAVWAARKKFLISRIGDMLLLSALALCYQHFGTADFEVLFQAGPAPSAGAFGVSPSSLIAWLLVLGAMTKSAQVPFHSWLPDTMETPTPVSALMHAGIINAGGFLVLRLSPLIESAPGALLTLVVVGLLTALLGSVAMLAQTSVKRALAYSTIGQMGFMMLQCGLGAYSAALLHLVAHSLYKAHAFLRSGTVTTGGPNLLNPNVASALFQLPVAVAAATTCLVFSSWLIGVDFASKAGGPTLVLILVLALTYFLWQALRTRARNVIVKALLAATFVTVSYCVGLTVTESILTGTAVPNSIPPLIEQLSGAIVAIGFGGLFLLHVCMAGSRGTWLEALHVHATHGFYLDIPARRITARIWGLKTPVP